MDVKDVLRRSNEVEGEKSEGCRSRSIKRKDDDGSEVMFMRSDKWWCTSTSK